MTEPKHFVVWNRSGSRKIMETIRKDEAFARARQKHGVVTDEKGVVVKA